MAYSKKVKNIAEKYKNNKMGFSKIKDPSNPDYDAKQKLLKETAFLDDYDLPPRTKLYHVLNDITEIPACEYCGGPSFINKNFGDTAGYNRFCSVECRNLGSNQKFHFSKEFLIQEHQEKQKTVTQIAKENNCSTQPIYSSFKKYGITTIDYKKKTNDVLKYLENYNWLHQKYCVEEKTCQQIADELENQTSRTLVSKYLEFHNIEARDSNYYDRKFPKQSSQEREIIDFIETLEPSITVEQNKRNRFNGIEIDIFVPKYNLAIEHHGLLFHSPEGMNKTDKFLHKKKADACIENGTQLFQILQSEWTFDDTSKEIWKSMIANKMGKNERIFARKCFISEIDATRKNHFLRLNHIQGADSSNIKIGLFYENELVGVMTFVYSRFNKKYEWELSRFATKRYTNIVGGFTKALNWFIKNYQPKSIVTYADRRYSEGNVYSENGFQKINVSRPVYYYFKEGNVLLNRKNFRKSYLPKKLDHFDPNKTEYQNMIDNGYKTFWNAGVITFGWTNQ